MMKSLLKLINNPTSIYYMILFYLLISVIFSIFYYLLFPAIEGVASLKHNNSPHYVNNYIDALYFSITSQTTVGYGDIVPATFLSKMAVMLQVVFGYFYLAFTIAIFTLHSILKSDKFQKLLKFYSNNSKDFD